MGPIFIVGVGRSGTSLLQSMLAGHSRLAFPPETAFLRRYVATGRLTRVARSGGKQAVDALLRADPRLQRVGLDVTRIVEEAAARGPLTGASVYRVLLAQYARQIGKPWMGDKDPRSIEFLGLLHDCFPEAHVVHVIRDPRDVLASKKQAAWSRQRQSLRHIFANRVQMKMGREDGPRLFGPRYHEVVYEKLIEEPELVLRALCQEIGIGFESAMLDFSREARRLVSDDEMQWKRETLGPLLSGNQGKWRGRLSAWEAALTERACVLAMKAGNHAPSDAARQLGPLARAALIGCSALLAISGSIYAFARRAHTLVVHRTA